MLKYKEGDLVLVVTSDRPNVVGRVAKIFNIEEMFELCYELEIDDIIYCFAEYEIRSANELEKLIYG